MIKYHLSFSCYINSNFEATISNNLNMLGDIDIIFIGCITDYYYYYYQWNNNMLIPFEEGPLQSKLSSLFWECLGNRNGYIIYLLFFENTSYSFFMLR